MGRLSLLTKTLLTKLVSENKTYQDEHLSTVLFSYRTTYKVTTWYTPYQLVYGLHPLMPSKYIILVASGDERDSILVRVLTSRITKLKKLQEARMQATKTIGIQQWNKTLWNQQKHLEKQFSFNDYVLWFPKGDKSHLGKFTKKWFGPYKVQYVLPNNIVLLVTIEKFETNLVLVNVNKLKPYKYMELKVQKNGQQMLIYWEKSASGIYEVNFDTKEDDENVKYKNHR